MEAVGDGQRKIVVKCKSVKCRPCRQNLNLKSNLYLKISSDTLLVRVKFLRGKCRWKFPLTSCVLKRNVGGNLAFFEGDVRPGENFHWHFGFNSRMSMEIFTDIIYLTVECRWKFLLSFSF